MAFCDVAGCENGFSRGARVYLIQVHGIVGIGVVNKGLLGGQ